MLAIIGFGVAITIASVTWFIARRTDKDVVELMERVSRHGRQLRSLAKTGERPLRTDEDFEKLEARVAELEKEMRNVHRSAVAHSVPSSTRNDLSHEQTVGNRGVEFLRAEPPRDPVDVGGQKVIRSDALDPIGWIQRNPHGKFEVTINQNRTMDADALRRWAVIFEFDQVVPERSYTTEIPAKIVWDPHDGTGRCEVKGSARLYR